MSFYWPYHTSPAARRCRPPCGVLLECFFPPLTPSPPLFTIPHLTLATMICIAPNNHYLQHAGVDHPVVLLGCFSPSSHPFTTLFNTPHPCSKKRPKLFPSPPEDVRQTQAHTVPNSVVSLPCLTCSTRVYATLWCCLGVPRCSVRVMSVVPAQARRSHKRDQPDAANRASNHLMPNVVLLSVVAWASRMSEGVLQLYSLHSR